MQKLFVLAAGVAAAVSFQVAPAFAAHGDASHSENMSLVANYSDGGTYRNGTDMAFWGDTLLLGNLDQGSNTLGGFRVMDASNPESPRQVARFACPGDQSDISIWNDIVVLSVDKPTPRMCETPGRTETWEGLRILSLSKVREAAPNSAGAEAILGTVETPCGSHTNTIYPDLENDRLLVYVLSYPLAGRYNPAQVMPTCNPISHRKISVVEVPLDNPSAARIVDPANSPSTNPAIGCHDVTVLLEKKLAAAACISETQIWDLSDDPAKPKIVGRVRTPEINIHHSTVFSNDGNTLVVGDELGGAAASPGCITDEELPHGGIFFYDMKPVYEAGNQGDPPLVGKYKLDQKLASVFCTAHLFNVVPRRDENDVLVSSWYSGATSVIDFTDPAKPKQIAYYIPSETTSPDEQPTEAGAWSSYWYNGYVFSNNFDEDVHSLSPRSRGLDVFALDHPLVNDGTVTLPYLNPQVQEPLPGGGGGGEIISPGKSGDTPAAEKRKGGPKKG